MPELPGFDGEELVPDGLPLLDELALADEPGPVGELPPFDELPPAWLLPDELPHPATLPIRTEPATKPTGPDPGSWTR
ncbi:hypothetical protein [Flexivirga caeni]|uniref:Uncharacterized protein n=1 Tax=Flexivirga caeni TaxID=2294115 RepID=A0A3M9ML73_9MICO|nr:hypothetical protein [Flexivirga caeni]RNI25418.1 hypothetical protein EFY87_02010 [Flexivirga caeni]